MDEQSRQVFLTLMQTQRWKRGDIAAYQWQLLEKLCRHARAEVPFYRDSGRLAPLFDGEDRFDPRGWREVPTLTRDEAWRNREALHAAQVPAVMRPLMLGSTTGSTGTPLPFHRSALSRVMAEAQLARALAWRKLGVLNPIAISKAVTGDAAGREAVIGPGDPVSDGDGPIHAIDFSATVEAQIAQLSAIRPRLIVTYPNVALSWIEAGFGFAGVHALVLTGETCAPEARARIEAAFAGPVVEIYSASEAGPIAIEGPAQSGGAAPLRICEENLLLEDPPPGTGRGPQPVIVTPFYAYGTPLIRYQPGDYAVFARGPAGDAPALRRIERVAGRLRNLFRRADGSPFWPNLSGVRLMRIAPHTHRQLIQEAHDRYRMRVVFDSPPSEAQLALIRAHVAEIVGGGEVIVEPVDAIDDGRTHGKAYENFVCRIPAR